MKAFDLDSSIRWLFCMTHPDDELAIAAWIKRLTSAGVEVWMSWTHDTPTRETEARAAAATLGVSSERLRFFHAEDGAVVDHLADLLPKFRAMIAEISPTRVVCGAFEQGHLDHDATNFLVNRSFEGPVLEAPFYHTYLTRMPRMNQFASPQGVETLELTAEERRFKYQLAKTYASQSIARNLYWANLRERALGREPLGISERLRLQTHKDYLSPNLPATLSNGVLFCSQWKRWVSALQDFVAAGGIGNNSSEAEPVFYFRYPRSNGVFAIGFCAVLALAAVAKALTNETAYAGFTMVFVLFCLAFMYSATKTWGERMTITPLSVEFHSGRKRLTLDRAKTQRTRLHLRIGSGMGSSFRVSDGESGFRVEDTLDGWEFFARLIPESGE